MRTTAGPGSTSVRDGGEKPSLNSYLNSEPNFITQPMGTDTSEQLSGCVGLALCLKREKRSLEGQVLASIHRLEIILRGETAEEWNDQGGNEWCSQGQNWDPSRISAAPGAPRAKPERYPPR